MTRARRTKRSAWAKLLVGAFLLWAAGAAVPAGASSSQAPPSLLPQCVYGSAPASLNGYEQRAISAAANTYTGNRQTFAAAAAAYVYGFPMIDELVTLKGYIHNTLINVDALANPTTKGVVSPNVDTAYSVAWIDLTQGPLVFTVPAMPDRFYTVQFMDGYTNAFAYVGSGSTGTNAGSYALVPPGWTGTLPAGVTKIQAPTNTLWLLGRTLVNSAADLPAVKAAQAGYKLTPLAAFETGAREGGISLASYPNGKPKVIPTGAKFIGLLNQDLAINPPPASDACAVAALSPAGVTAPTVSSSDELAADGENIAGDTPAPADDPAVDAGLAAGKALVATAAQRVQATLAERDRGWAILTSGIGTYGNDDIARAIIATNYLGANTPVQGVYPTDTVDVDGKPLTGTDDNTITFPAGDLPPAGAFWSLTMYGADNYLVANAMNRYAIGNRTSGLVYAKDGSLTLHLSHAEPASGASNWLPAPDAGFHVILRLYEPAASVLDGRWTPPPIYSAGESLRPLITKLKLKGTRLSWVDSQATTASIQLTQPDGSLRILTHRDRHGRNSITLVGLRSGTYRLTLTPAKTLYDSGAGRTRRLSFRIRRHGHL